jgi:hypothetical protein
MSLFSNRTPVEGADAFQGALEQGYTADPEVAQMVSIARALAMKTPAGYEADAQVRKDVMLRAFDRKFSAHRSPTASTLGEGHDQVSDVFTAEVLLPDGGRVVMADVEHISTLRAEEASHGVLLSEYEAVAPDDVL